MKHKEQSSSPSLASPVLPPAFTLAHYHLTLEALEPLHLPPFKGSALRGGFGHTFKRLVCFQPRPCGDRCALGNACPYGYIFETAPPADSEVLRTQDEVPRPFVIEPPDDQRTLTSPDEPLAMQYPYSGTPSTNLGKNTRTASTRHSCIRGPIRGWRLYWHGFRDCGGASHVSP